MKPDEPTIRAHKPSRPEWGSDAMAEVLSQLGIRYVSLTPGASYRGIHDSIVNYLGNDNPQMVLCLHEEHAVALAHGYAKVTGEPLAVALHSNVGLMHAIMAIYNAYCARVPMLILGATGPIDASLRRPWIDWIHTAADQGAMIRNFSKWDDQPGSVSATMEALLRANVITRTYPSAPTYVCVDSTLQESPCPEDLKMPDVERYHPVPVQSPSELLVDEIADRLSNAKRPLVLMGRVGRNEQAWQERIQLADAFGTYVLTNIKDGSVFPTGHAANPIPPMNNISKAGGRLIRNADVILALDWVDLASAFRQAYGTDPVDAYVISCSSDFVLHNGWSKDHFGLAPTDLAVATHPDALVAALITKAKKTDSSERWDGDSIELDERANFEDDGQIMCSTLARSLREALDGRSATFAALPLGWSGHDLDVSHPLDYLGGDGGGGVGYGPGGTVGVALALEGTGRIAIGILGDGDFLMGSSALWTAVHYKLPLLIIVANNRSFHNDEVHQYRMAVMRGRPIENRWLGQYIREPDPDLAAIARSYGLKGYGPIDDPSELTDVLAQAIKEVEAGAAVLVDVRVGVGGYPGEEMIADRGGTAKKVN